MDHREFGPMRWSPRDRLEPDGSPLVPPPADDPAVSLASLDHLNCLVLLGGAGSGKTTDLKIAHDRLRDAGARSVLIPLHTIRDAGDLAHDIDPGIQKLLDDLIRTNTSS
jgi:hypothetical protein